MVVVRKLLSPTLLMPLALVTPYVFLGPYGVSLFEALILMAFFTHALPGLFKGSFRLPRFLLIYLVLFCFGWLGGVINGASWGMPVGLWNLNFFYKVVLAIGGFYVGYRLYEGMDAVVTGKLLHVVVVGVAVLAAVYPFMTYDQRVGLMSFYYAGTEEMTRLRAPRFPGLGINANIYSFMVFIFLLFSFDAHLRKRSRAIVPLLAIIPLAAAASKLVIVLSAASCLVLLACHSVSFPGFRLSKRVLVLGIEITALASAAVLYLTRTSFGALILETVQAFGRFADALAGTGTGIGTRSTLWQMGLERVRLAPVFGIVRNRYVSSDSITLFYTTPHNEFIEQWMFYGLAGVIAHIFLIGVMVAKNIQHNAPKVWLLFYLGLTFQMFFDGAFSYVRFYALFFVVAGTNLGYLRSIKRTTPLGSQMERSGSLVSSP